MLKKATNPLKRVFSGAYRNIFEQRERANPVLSQKRLRVVGVSALSAILIFGLTVAESKVEPLRKLDTLHVFSARVESHGWHNAEEVRNRALSDNALYQGFTERNAAFIHEPVTVFPTQPQTIPNLPTTDSTDRPADSEMSLPLGESVENKSDIETTTKEDTTGLESLISEPRTTVSPESESGAESELLPTQSSSEETISQNKQDSFFYYVTKLARALPFVQESIIEPVLVENTEPNAEIVSVSNEITVPTPDSEPQSTSTEPDSAVSGSGTLEESAFTPTAANQQGSQENVLAQPEPTLDTETALTANGSQKDVVEAGENNPSITFTDFGIPALGSGQFITNVQLRLSMAAEPKSTENIAQLLVEYLDENEWREAGSIIINEQVSNALNGGYFLFALPQFTSVKELKDFAVRVSYQGDTDARVYLDALWLEVDTETYDRTILRERLNHQILSRLAVPKIHTLISEQLDFTRDETPRFILRYESQRNLAVRALRGLFSRELATVEEVAIVHKDLGRITVTPQVDITAEGLLSLRLDDMDRSELPPGTYEINITVAEGGKTFTDSFEFQWGLLAVNPNQTQYQLGDTAEIALGALSPSGNTLCEADLRLYVIDPTNYITLVPVQQSGLCNGNNVVDRPDYFASYLPNTVGEYEIYVEHRGADDAVLTHTSDTFRVAEMTPLSLERLGPTRIYPQAVYPMTLTVTAAKAWQGVLTERVNADFEVTDTDATITHANGGQVLNWTVDIGAGETQSFTYYFDAPDISPFLYTLGPASLVRDDGTSVVAEIPVGRQTLVNETVTEFVAEAENTNATPVEEEPVPETPIEEPASVTVPTTGTDSVPVTQPTITEVTDELPPTSTTEEERVPEAPVVAPVVTEDESPSTPTLEEDSTITSPTTEATASNDDFTEHRAWQIASDATGSMIVFWTDGATIPAGWTCISCTATSTFYQRFPLGGPGYGTTSGTSTHLHTASGSVDPSATVNTENSGAANPSANSTHGHAYTPTIAGSSTLPAYRQLRVIQNNSAGTPTLIPAGAVLVFDNTLPADWTRYSALDDRYPRGENTITSAGANTHTHAISGSTDAAGGTSIFSRNGGTRVTAADTTHTHTVSTSSPSANHEPPYIEVIFATSSVATATPLSAIALWSDEPPAGWINRSAEAGQPFYSRYIKGAASYGTTGGTETHAHNDTTVTSGAAVGTVDARSGGVGSSNTHTHLVSITDFSTASNTPPAVMVIFAKYIGLVPSFKQSAYRFYVNVNAQTPTDPWPAGGTDLAENEPITILKTPVKTGDIVRLRLQAAVTNSTTTANSFKLQYGTTTAACTAVPNWTDVGAATSSAIWRGYNNSSVSDGVTLTTALLASTTVLASYEENNPTVTLPTEIGPGKSGEWDFVLEHNGAAPGTEYCFRLVEADGAEFFTYTKYPRLLTNASPLGPALSKPFDNEKISTATSTFEFVATDAEVDSLTYQIQIDDAYDFSSVNIDRNSESNGTQFSNLVTPANKDPFNNGELIRFTLTTPLTNGVTYYWRVRARDPSGSTEWGQWSTISSLTVDTGVTVSTWYQTMEEQFDTNTHDGTDATGSDLVQLATGSTTGTTTSSAITIQSGANGNAWGSLTWTDNETVGDIKYRIQYYSAQTAAWLFVPETALTGNATGFDTSPVSLLSLDTDIYHTIRIVAVLTNAGGSPTLSDWTVSWGYRITTPTSLAPFASEKVGTTTPSFRFITSDPQGDDLTYEIQWSTSALFTSSTTRSSDLHNGFVNTVNGGDTNPFTSGEIISFTMQGGDTLTNNTTYWWRVRARDPLGDNSFSFWSTERSFTVDTTTTVSTWFQTTAEQFDRNILSGTVAVPGGVSVATSATEALLVYGEGTQNNPRYRLWDGSGWGSEGTASGVSAAQNWVVTRAGSTREEYVTATLGTNASVRAQVYQNQVWANEQTITSNSGNAVVRGFDVAYETLSGDALVVACNNTTNPIYYVWDGASWTSGGSITMTYTGNCEWLQLAANPTSDEMVLLARNAAGTLYEAVVWNGNSWGNSGTLGSIANSASEGMAIVYEESGGQALVVASDGNPSRFAWRAWNGATWSAAATVALSGRLQWGELVRNVGNDQAALCYVDHNNNVGVVRWDGSAWTGQTNLDAAANTTASRPVSCAFETTVGRTNYLMVAYSDATNARYQFWNGTTWSGESSISTIVGGPVAQIRRTGDGMILGLFFDATNDRYDASTWNGSSWTTFTTLESDASVGTAPYKEPFMIAPRKPSKEGVAVVSPPIVWSEGSGPYFAEFSWSDSQPGTSDIVYQLQYYDVSTQSWKFIPNSALAGNEAGFSTSPINLSGLSITTYHTIRPYATLSCDGSNNCPTVNDWTVEWAEGISISGTAQQYDRTTNVTSGTVAVAVNGVLQSGKTGTIAAGSWSIVNVNTLPGDIITVFVSDAVAANEAVAVARNATSSNMAGLTLYERHLTLGSSDATTTPLTNAQLGLYDFTNDEDLFFNGVGSDLALCADSDCADANLLVRAGVVYDPGGQVSLHDLINQGTISLRGNSLSLTGSWYNSATVTAATSSVQFVATSTSEIIDETGANSPAFYNVNFGTTTGNATWSLLTPLTINNDLTVTRGTLARGTSTIAVSGSLTNTSNGYWTGIGTTTFTGAVAKTWTDQNAMKQNIGHVLIDGTSKTITLGSNVFAESITIGADDILDASTGNHTVSVKGNWSNGNTFVARGGTVSFVSTSTNRLITPGNSNFFNLNFNGAGGTWSFTAPAVSILGNLTIATGTVTLPTATTTITGSFTNSGGTFAHNNGTILFNATTAQTLTLGGTAFTNAFYNARFTGSGSWSFTETNATTSNNFVITQGTVTLPSGILSVGASFLNTAGTFAHNSGTLRLTGSGTHSIDTNANFNNLSFTGSGSWSFVDSTVTALGNLVTSAGTVTLPSSMLTLGGSLSNTATLTHSSGTVLFNSNDTGETISLGSSNLYNVTLANPTGGWTILGNASTTNNFTLATSSAFTLQSGSTLAVGGVFSNSVGGASTTWTGSTLSLESGDYSMNSKTTAGDLYDTLRVKSGARIALWSSSANAYSVSGSGSLYSQDHAGVDGELYIFGAYARNSGTEHWSYDTDFDGTTFATSSRPVAVRFADGASATILNSTLSIVGQSSASTTIQNQGSGSYAVTVNSGTTTLSHYEFSNLGLSGLTLQGSTTVTSLADGRFVPGVNTGTALTVSSTTIDRNPGLQIYRVNFSTTTAITATNVTQLDGIPASYWWFRESAGNLDGENFDNDTGDPGSIRWDDSSLTITVSGTVYSANTISGLGAPTCGAGTPVRVVVAGGASYDGACDGSGNYSIPGVVVVGDPTLTVYLNGASGGERAVTVTKTPTTDITNLDLIVNRVIVRHEDMSPMTIADLARFDSSDDSDIPFTAATGTTHTLTVASDTELRLWSGKIFSPGGDVAVLGAGGASAYDGSLYLSENSQLVGSGTSTYSIGGLITQRTGAAMIPASSTVFMTATTTGKAIITESNEVLAIHNLELVGAGGGWNLNGNLSLTGNLSVATGTLTGTGNITLTNGSLAGSGLVSLGSGTTTLGRTNTLGGNQAWTFANLILGNGSVVGTTTPASSATTTVSGRLTIAVGHYLDAGSSVWDLQGSGNVLVENGTLIENTSTIRYSGTAGANVHSTNYYNLSIAALGGTPTYTATGLGIVVHNNLVIGGTAPTTFTLATNNSALDVNGGVTITAAGTLLASPSAAFTLAGDWNNSGSFVGNGGTLIIDGSGAQVISAGVSTFSNVTVNAVGTQTIVESATTTNALLLTATGGFSAASSTSLAVGGTFTNGVNGALTTWTGATLHLYGGNNYQVNGTTTSDIYNRLVISGTTQIRLWNSSATAYDVATTASLYSQDHNGVDGQLYIFGAYTKSSGTDFWSYAHDFNGQSLVGGNERVVTVSFANAASAVYTGGGLHVLGTQNATTTIKNQGSGTYGLRIGGAASTTFSYYEIQNLNGSGLIFSGTPTVHTLSYGEIHVETAAGSAITVGGTVINQNPAKTFTNNYFATTSPITAYNVTATGTTVSSWRFTNHSGTLAGEAYDVDPDGNPGYIVWDNSSSTISISGVVYSDEGVTPMGGSVCDGTTPSIHIKVAGLTSYTSSCAVGTGVYTVSGINYSPGDSLIAYIDNETEKAATVSRGPVSNINNFDLYENRVIVRDEDTTPLTIAAMAVWDSSDDPDIPFTAVDAGTDTLTLPANRQLMVWTNKTFLPLGNVTITGGGAGAAHDGTLVVMNNARFTSTGSETHTIGGSVLTSSGAIINAASSTLTFTTTGTNRTIDTNNATLHNLTFNGSGSWTIADTTLTLNNNFTLTQGAVTLPAATTTVGGSFLNTGGSFNQNGGWFNFIGSGAKTIRQNSSVFGTTTFNGSGSWAYLDTNATTTGDFVIRNGTVTVASGTLAIGGRFDNQAFFAHNNGTLRFYGGAASTPVLTNGSDLSSVTAARSGNLTFVDSNATLLGSLRIESGSVTLATGTLAIGGSFLNTGGSFAHSSGTVLFNSADTGESINPGSSNFYSVTVAAPTGGYTLTAPATTTAHFSLTSAQTFTINPGQTLSVGGLFTNTVGGVATTWTGSTLILRGGQPYTINTKVTGGDSYDRVHIGNNTDVRMWNSSATTTILDSESSLYSMNASGVPGELYIHGHYERSSGADYWSYATDFDGASLVGSERAVWVRHAAGATTTIRGGTLNIIGSSIGTTTITNQGSGIYSFNILGGTFAAQQFALRNLDATGLRLSDTTSIASFSSGDFELAVSGGTLLTISSTTLNFNASLVVSNSRFATTTAISGANATVVGSTPSSWRFTDHRGNLAGEAFDVDGGTACGSLRWDDSSCLLTEQTAYRWRIDDGGEGVPNSEWYDLDWSRRARITATNPDATTYTDTVVKVVVPYDSDMQADFDDIRFTAADGVTPLNYVRETYSASTEATHWVKLPSLTASIGTSFYMYYGNGGATNAGVGTSTFIVYDDFEDGNISEYSTETSLFSVDGTFAYQGSYGLKAVNPLGKTNLGVHDFNRTVSQGETIRFFQYISTSGSGASDETCTLFGAQSPGSDKKNYAVCLEQYGVDRVSIAKYVYDRDIDGTVLASTTISYTTGWYEVEARWGTDDTIAVSVYRDGSLVATTSATDSEFTSGGIGFTYWGQHGGWDLYSSRPLLVTEPTVTIGGEQVSGGASWLAPVNTTGSGITTNMTLRGRFVVLNTGLSVTDAYQLEYAPKGASPSCLAVGAGSYVTVPTQASCAGSPVCMQSSTEFANEAPTTDLVGSTGTFVPGQIIENPSNTTQSLTLASGEYTEVEYAITMTNEATDSNYCFRVSDAGSALDSYARIAELALIFEPNITSLSLNGGSDISLAPGATTTIHATGTVSDLNGYADIVTATTTIFRSGVGASCAPDNNNCYIASGSQCNFYDCAGNTCKVTCSVDFYYHADPTDIGTYAGETWRAQLEVRDQGNSIATATAPSIDLLTLRAITVSQIDYGALEVNADTGSFNASTTVENIGNDSLNVAIEGTDLTDGGTSVIPVNQQKFATSTFTYSGCVVCAQLDTNPTTVNLDLPKPASTTPSITDTIFWGIAIPYGVAARPHQGSNIFYATGE